MVLRKIHTYSEREGREVFVSGPVSLGGTSEEKGVCRGEYPSGE